MKRIHENQTRFCWATYAKFIAILALIFSGNAINAQRVLVYSDHQPLEGMRTKFLNEVFFPAIERESKGRLKVEAHWNGELAIAYDALGAVKSGEKVDISTVVPEYTSKELPLHQIFKSFLVGPTGKEQVDFFRKVYDQIPAFSSEFADNNIKEIFLATGYPVGFFSRTQISDLSDLAGQKWRSASFWHLDFLQNLGATPVRMHWGEEIYNALQEGNLDGIFVNVDSGDDLKVYEHAPYVLVSQDLWLGHLYPVAMNQKTWQSLEPRDQKAIQRAAVYAYKKLGTLMDNSFKALMESLEEKGAEIRYLSGTEMEYLKAQSKYQAIQDKWVEEQLKEGVDAKSAMEEVRALLKQYLKDN